MKTPTKQSVIKLDAPPGPVVVITPEKHQERDDILALASVVKGPLKDAGQMIAATEVLGRLDTMSRVVEKEGEKLRQPFTAFARKIKGAVDLFLIDVGAERSRIGGLIADRADEERKAAAELEAHRQRDAEEVQRKARGETERIEREQMKANDAKYARLEEQKRLLAMQAEKEARKFATTAPIEAPSIPGMVARKPVWRFEVLDVDQLPPEFVKRVANEIALEIAVKNGVREIKGVRIYEETPGAFTRSPTRAPVTYAKGSE